MLVLVVLLGLLLVGAASHSAKGDDPNQPGCVGACDGENDDGKRACDPIQQCQPKADEQREHDAARDRPNQRTGDGPWAQTSTTWKSLTAPSTVPE